MRLLEQRPLALGRLGRKKLEGNHRPPRLARVGKDVAYETHVQISYRNEDRRMRARPPLRRGGGPRSGGDRAGRSRAGSRESDFKGRVPASASHGVDELDSHRDRMGVQGRHVHVDRPARRSIRPDRGGGTRGACGERWRARAAAGAEEARRNAHCRSCSNTSRFTSTSPRWRSERSARASRTFTNACAEAGGTDPIQQMIARADRDLQARAATLRSRDRPRRQRARPGRSGSGGYRLF